jgi:hypothetical protein
VNIENFLGESHPIFDRGAGFHQLPERPCWTWQAQDRYINVAIS